MNDRLNQSIVLIGFRGSGKTTIGRLLAQKLNYPFVDTDAEIVAHTGMTIQAIFEKHGEAAFRAHESRIIQQLESNPPRVISVGGGAVLSEENRLALRKLGTIVWLTASMQELMRREQHDPSTANLRPALTTFDRATEWQHLWDTRMPIYAACCELSVCTEQHNPDEIARSILTALGH